MDVLLLSHSSIIPFFSRSPPWRGGPWPGWVSRSQPGRACISPQDHSAVLRSVTGLTPAAVSLPTCRIREQKYSPRRHGGTEESDKASVCLSEFSANKRCANSAESRSKMNGRYLWIELRDSIEFAQHCICERAQRGLSPRCLRASSEAGGRFYSPRAGDGWPDRTTH